MAGAPAAISDNEVILRIGATERWSLRHHESTILALKLFTSRLLYETDSECPDCLLWVQALQHHRYDFVVQLLSCVQLFATPGAATCQASLSFTISWSLLKLMSIESMISSNYLILCHPLLLLPSIFPSIRVFSKQLAFHIRWPKYRTLPNSLYEASITLIPKQIKALQVGKTTEEHLWWWKCFVPWVQQCCDTIPQFR